MTNFDTELGDRLASLADKMPTAASDLADAARAGAHGRRVNRLSVLGALAGAVITAAIVVPLSVIHGDDRIGTSQRLNPGTHDIGRSAFQVTAPVGPHPSAILRRQPTCSPSEVSGHVELKSTSNGVEGVATLLAQSCSLPDEGIGFVIPSHGEVRTTPLNYYGPPDTINNIADPVASAFALAQGRAAIGFAWLGSWCGPPPTTMQAVLPNGTVRLPVIGSPPGCTGTTRYSIVPGNTAAVGDPALGAPASWQRLKAYLTANGPNTAVSLVGVEVTFVNPTNTDIWLDPVPNYVVGVHDRSGDGTPVETMGPLPYLASDLSVQAHHSLTVRLPDIDISADASNFVKGPVFVTFSIAGVRTATTQTHVPR